MAISQDAVLIIARYQSYVRWERLRTQYACNFLCPVVVCRELVPKHSKQPRHGKVALIAVRACVRMWFMQCVRACVHTVGVKERPA